MVMMICSNEQMWVVVVGGVSMAGKGANAIKRLDSVSLFLCWQVFCLSHNCWQVIVGFWKLMESLVEVMGKVVNCPVI